MATQPVPGSTSWGAAQNAFTGTSIDPDTGKIKNEALQVADTAPIADAALANKKYVDDNLPTSLSGVNEDPSEFNIGELEVKIGITAGSGSPRTVTFATPFSNACYFAVATNTGTGASNQTNLSTNTLTQTNMKVYNSDQAIRWIAVGY